MAGWHERLKERLDELGWSAVTLAERSGLPEQSIYKYLQGRVANPRRPVPEKIATTIGVSIAWLMHDVGPKLDNSRIPLDPDRLPMVNILGWSGVERELAEMIAAAVEFVPVPAGLSISGNAFCVRINDDANRVMPIGSIVIVDPDRKLEPSRYVLAWSKLARGPVIRKWKPSDYSGKGFLLADNDFYPVIPLDGADDGHIVGRVTMVLSEL